MNKKLFKNSAKWVLGGALIGMIAFSSCKKDDDGGNAIQEVTKISPSMAEEGDTVKIIGTNLSTVSSVKIGGQKATVLSKSDTKLTVVIPVGPTSGDVVIASSATTLTEDIVIKYNVTSFEDAANDKILNVGWWSYGDPDDDFVFDPASTINPYKGTMHLHVEGNDSLQNYWIGGANQNTGGTGDPAFGISTAPITDTYFNYHILGNDSSSVSVSLRQTISENTFSVPVPIAGSAYELVSVSLDQLTCDGGCTDDGVISPELINGIGLNFGITWPPSKEKAFIAQIDNIYFTVGGPGK